MVFKLKVVDALKPQHSTAYITFFEQNEEAHQSLKPGDRVRLMNVTPSNVSGDQILNLNFVKTSKIFHITDSVLKPKKETALMDRYRPLIEKSLTLAEFKRRYNELQNPKDTDIGFHCYILKIISSKNQ